MTRSKLQKQGWTLFDIPDMTKIGLYAGWSIFLNLTDTKVFYAGDGVHRNIKAGCLREIQKKIDNQVKSAEILRKHCQVITKDKRKCEYCDQRFICFTAEKDAKTLR